MKKSFRANAKYDLYVGKRHIAKVRILGQNSVDRQHVVVTESGRVFHQDLSRLRVERASSQKSRNSVVYLYLMDLGRGYYKLGVSKDPEARRRQLMTGAVEPIRVVGSFALPEHQSAQFRTFELRLLRNHPEWCVPRGGTEVLCMSTPQCNRLLMKMRTLCQNGL